MKASAIKEKAFDYIAKNPNRFPVPHAAFSVISQCADEWEQKTGADIHKLELYFERRPSGKFVLPFLNN